MFIYFMISSPTEGCTQAIQLEDCFLSLVNIDENIVMSTCDSVVLNSSQSNNASWKSMKEIL